VLNRTAVVVSRLRGLALFHSSSGGAENGLSASKLHYISEIIGALRLAGHMILHLVMEEIDQFNAYSAWLRMQVERAALSPEQAANEDVAAQDKEASIDVGKVLLYVQRSLVPSVCPTPAEKNSKKAEKLTPLGIFLEELPASTHEFTANEARLHGETTLLELVKAQIEQAKRAQPFDHIVPNLGFLVSILHQRVNSILNATAEAKKKSVRFGQPMRLIMGSNIRTIADVDAVTMVSRSQV